eukprot:973234-Rhodomonas_salina.1
MAGCAPWPSQPWLRGLSSFDSYFTNKEVSCLHHPHSITAPALYLFLLSMTLCCPSAKLDVDRALGVDPS